MSDITISAVPATLIEFIWPNVEPYLARVVAVANEEISLATIKNKLLTGNSMLLVVIKGNEIIAAITTEKLTFESGRSALVLPIIGGDEMDEWLDQLFEVAKLIAKDIGCQELRGLGARKGWSRKLKNLGWEDAYTVVKYDLGY